MKLQGLLADVNVEGHLPYIRRLLETSGLWSILVELNVRFATFKEIQLPPNISDRALWRTCQQDGWVLFTENRNHDGPDSLEATLSDSWTTGQLPVLTLANKTKLERDPDYAGSVADTIADVLFGISGDREYCDRPRIFVPN